MVRLTAIFFDDLGAQQAAYVLRQMQEMPLAITVERIPVVDQAPVAPTEPATQAIVLAPKGN